MKAGKALPIPTALDAYALQLKHAPRVAFRFCRGRVTCDEEAEPGTILCPWCKTNSAAVEAARAFALAYPDLIPANARIPPEVTP